LSEKQSFWNRKVGGVALGITILILYIGFKVVNVGISPTFFWYSFWFFSIIINALMTDLFQNTETWIFNSMHEIERKDIDDKLKFDILKEQLGIAVNRYDSIFFAVNGKDWGKIFKRIWGGSITVKELIVVFLYAIYDLVLKSGYLSMLDPWDIMIVFSCLIGLKIIDAKTGFAGLVTEMYNKAFKEEYTSTTLNVIRGYIRQICLLFHINFEEETEKIRLLPKNLF